MKPIRNKEDIENLKTDVSHPRNKNYVILLNHCEEPERFYVKSIIDRFYTDCTTRDIIIHRRDYALKKLEEYEQALSEFNKEEKE